MPNQILNFAERADRDVALIDGRELRRAGLVAILSEWAGSNSITLSSFDSPVAFAASECSARCRMVILSIGGTLLDDPDLLAGIEQVRAAAPDASLVILSDHEDPGQVVAAFHAGVKGYMSMGTEPAVALRALGFIVCGGSFFPPQALADLSQVSAMTKGLGAGLSDQAGHPILLPAVLTSRQREVLDCLRYGKSNKQIARELNMQEATVKVHIRQIMRKLRVRNRVQAAIEATRLFEAAKAEAQARSEMAQGSVADVESAPVSEASGPGTATSAGQQEVAGSKQRPTLSPFGMHLTRSAKGPPSLVRQAVTSKH